MNSRSNRTARALLRETERNFVLPSVALCFLFSVWLAPRLVIGAWAWALLPLAALLGLALRLTGRRILPAILLGVFATGLLWTQAWLSPNVPPTGQTSAEGYVCGEPTQRSGNRISFRLTRVRLDGESAGDAYCTAYWYGEEAPPALFDGAWVRFNARVYEPSGKANEYDFDFRMWLLSDGISYGLSGVRDLEVLNSPADAPWIDVAGRLRAFFESRLQRVMGDDARLAMALLLSDRDGLAAEEQEAFRTLGVAHVMAVSGLHVGLLAALLVLLMDTLRVNFVLQLPLLGLFLAFYCLVTGFSPASVRAAIASLLALTAYTFDREPEPAFLLADALIVVLAVNPLQLFTASFVLSFCAMGGILLLAPATERGLCGLWALLFGPPPEREKWKYIRRSKRKLFKFRLGQCGKRLLQLFCTGVGAQIGVYFPTAAFFHYAPLYGLAFNLVIVPMVGLLVPLYAATLLLADVPWVGAALGYLSQKGGGWLLSLVQYGASLPYASLRVATTPVLIVAATLGCALAVSGLLRASWKRRALTILLTCGIACASLSFAGPSALRYHQFSVGQGDAALIVDGPYTVAIDAGPYGSELTNRLLAEGRNLDALILTHLHYDHVQGVSELLDCGISIDRVYLPEGAEKQAVSAECLAVLDELRAAGIPIQALAAGDQLRYNRTVIDVLWPESGRTRSGMDANARPLALSIDLGGVRILSLSDLCNGLDDYVVRPCDVLKVAHHGSAESTSDAALSASRPSVAIVTCSSGDDELPAAETLARIAAHGIDLYRTDETGEITLTVENGRLRVHTYKARSSE